MPANLILIDCHDIGDYLSCYGKAGIQTPNLDRFAERSLRCQQFIAAAPTCMPSRVAMLSGLHPSQCGIFGQESAQGEVDWLGNILGRHGYHCLGAGNNLREPFTKLGFQQGFKQHDWPEALRQAQSHAQNHPVFLHLSLSLAHRPYGSETDSHSARAMAVPAHLPDVPTMRADLGSFARHVKRLDEQCAAIFAGLEAHGFTSANSLMIFTTDHGPAWLRGKHTLYDLGLRCALLLHMDGIIPAGSCYDGLMSNVDFLPTVLDLLQIKEVPTGTGMSHAKAMCDKQTDAVRTTAFSAFTWQGKANGKCWYYSPRRSIRSSTYKLIRNFTDRPNYLNPGALARFGPDRHAIAKPFATPSPPWELYDLVTDPGEMHNLSGHSQLQEIEADLREHLQAHLEQIHDPILQGPIPNGRNLPEEPQWLQDDEGHYRLVEFREEECVERPFP